MKLPCDSDGYGSFRCSIKRESAVRRIVADRLQQPQFQDPTEHFWWSFHTLYCSQPMTTHRDKARGGQFLPRTGLSWWKALFWGLSINLNKTLPPSMVLFPSLLFQGQTVLSSKGSAWLLLLLFLLLSKMFTPINLLNF